MTHVLFDEAQFLASLADDDELARELLAAFLEDSPQRLAALRQAIEGNEAQTVSKLAHSLKGMCGVVRATALSELALNMEHKARDGRLEEVTKHFATFSDLHTQAVSLMQAYIARD